MPGVWGRAESTREHFCVSWRAAMAVLVCFLSMRRCGLGVPSVLMLHASPGSSIMFVSALKRLAARGLHAVALDLPNCGESCRTAEEPKVADLADAVLQAAQALRFSASIDLVSTGTAHR